MRSSRRLFATVTTASARHAERYLTPGNPTGLTGFRTHPCPRSALIYTYETTLSKLAGLPASSAYRTAAEAVTRHRLGVVRAVEPAGYAAWAEGARALLDKHPEAFGREVLAHGANAPEAFEARRFQREGFVRERHPEARAHEWDGHAGEEPLEGERTQEERDAARQRDRVREESRRFEGAGVEWVDSPAWEAAQVEEVEEKIGAGLIEEVIHVATGESKLVDQMLESRVWEELTDKAPHGQWEYFGRAQHMPLGGTQAPPKE